MLQTAWICAESHLVPHVCDDQQMLPAIPNHPIFLYKLLIYLSLMYYGVAHVITSAFESVLHVCQDAHGVDAGHMHAPN